MIVLRSITSFHVVNDNDQFRYSCFCILLGYFGQLPPSSRPPALPGSFSLDLGSSAYQMFNTVITLEKITCMRQSGDDSSRVLFHEILLRIRNGMVTENDWKILLTRTPAQSNTESLMSLHLYY